MSTESSPYAALASADPVRVFGTVKRFGDAPGYGWITADAGGPDVFVHHSAIMGQSGRRTLHDGQRVSFVVEHSDKGLRAAFVRVEPAA